MKIKEVRRGDSCGVLQERTLGVVFFFFFGVKWKVIRGF